VKRYPTNWELAGARAASVVRLFAHSGLPAKRLLAVSMADVRPVTSNSTPEGRARNRRIEIRLRPISAEE
jgi:chemotaxis protein MotB